VVLAPHPHTYNTTGHLVWLSGCTALGVGHPQSHLHTHHRSTSRPHPLPSIATALVLQSTCVTIFSVGQMNKIACGSIAVLWLTAVLELRLAVGCLLERIQIYWYKNRKSLTRFPLTPSLVAPPCPHWNLATLL